MDAALIVAVVLLILLALVVAGLSFQRRTEREAAEKELTEARAALTSAQRERDQAVADRDEARQARLQADQHLATTRKEAESARTKVTDLEQRVADARHAMNERDELSRTSREQGEQLAALEVELRAAKDQLSTAADDLTAARQRASEAEEELSTADRRVAEIEKDVHDELQSLRSQLADARDDLAVARSEAEQARRSASPAAVPNDAAGTPDDASEPVLPVAEVGGVAATTAPMTTLVDPATEAGAAGTERAVGPPLVSVGAEAVGLWDLELLRLQRNAASIDQAHVAFSNDPGEALVQALQVEVSALRDLVGTGGEVHAESMPPVSPATALVALRVSQEILGAIARQCDRIDVVVSDEDGLTVTVAGQQPDQPVDPLGVVERLASGARGGVDIAVVPEDDAYLVVANFAGVERSGSEASDGDAPGEADVD